MAGQTRYPLIAWLVEFQTAHSASERKSFKDAGLENVSDSSLQSNISRIKDEILLFLNVARVGRREHAVRHQRLGWDAPHVRRAVGREVHDHEDVESITNVAVCVWPVEFVTNFFFVLNMPAYLKMFLHVIHLGASLFCTDLRRLLGLCRPCAPTSQNKYCREYVVAARCAVR